MVNLFYKPMMLGATFVFSKGSCGTATGRVQQGKKGGACRCSRHTFHTHSRRFGNDHLFELAVVTSATFKSDGFHCYMQQTLHLTTTTLTLVGSKYVLLCKRILSLRHFSGEKGKLSCRSQVLNPLLNDVSELKIFPFL